MHVGLIIKNEFRRSRKNKKKLLITLIIPVMAVIFAMGVNILMKPSINIGIINEENSILGRDFETRVSSIRGIKIIKAERATINTDMIMAKYASVIEFKQKDNVDVLCIDSELQSTIKDIVNNYIKTGSVQGLTEILNRMKEESMTVAQRSVGFILLTLIITCTIAACNIIKDKEEGTLRRYSLTPNAPSAYILGTFLFNLIITLFQIVISATVIYLFRLDIGLSIYKFLFIGFIIAITASSIATLMVNLVKTELKASLIASSFGMLASLLGGAFLPLDKMPNGIKFLSNLSITKWLILFTGSLNSGIAVSKVITSILVILVMSIVFIFCSIIFGKKSFV